MKTKCANILLVGLVISLFISSGCAVTRGAVFTIGDPYEYHDVVKTNKGLYYLTATTTAEYEKINSDVRKGSYLSQEAKVMLEVDAILGLGYDVKLLLGDLYVSDKSKISMPSILVKYPIDHRGYESLDIIWDGRNTNGDKTNSTLRAGDIPWVYYKAIAVGLNRKGFKIVGLNPNPLASKKFPGIEKALGFPLITPKRLTIIKGLTHHDFERILTNTTPDYVLEVNILKTKRNFKRDGFFGRVYQDFELATELKIYDSQSKKLISQAIVNSKIPDGSYGAYTGWIPRMFITVLEYHFKKIIKHSVFESLKNKTAQINNTREDLIN